MMAVVNGERERFGFLSDKPLDSDAEDRLGFKPYADAIAELIDNPETDTPLTIAINASWGAGKTSLARMIERRLRALREREGKRQHAMCWFEAWMHDDAEHLGAAFAADVARSANRDRYWERFLRPLPSAMLPPHSRFRRRVFLALIALAVGIVAATQFGDFFDPNEELVDQITGEFGALLGSITGALIVTIVVFTKSFSVAESVAGFVESPKSEAANGSMSEVRSQLGRLIRQVTRPRLLPRSARDARRVVIFVDDLERCRPPRAVEVCEVASQLLGHENVVIVLIGDMQAIAASAGIKYKELGTPGDVTKANTSNWTYGREYLQKIVQLQFDLPDVPVEQMGDLRVVTSSMNGQMLEAGVQTVEDNDAQERDPRVQLGEARESASGWAGGVAVVAVFGGFIAGFLGSDLPGWLQELIPVLTSVLVFASAVPVLFRAVVLWRRSRAASEIDVEIRRLRLRSDLEVAKSVPLLMDEIRASAAAKTKGSSLDLLRQLVERSVTNDLRAEGEAEILPYLPVLPRAAKRVLNQWGLWLAVGVHKGIFEPATELSPRHLAKWVVFNEVWPEISAKVKRDPERLSEMETASTDDQLWAEFHKGIGSPVDSLGRLRQFLESKTKLSDEIDRLTYFHSGPVVPGMSRLPEDQAGNAVPEPPQ